LVSLSIPIGYWYASRELALSVILPLFVVSLVLDLGRHYIPPLAHWFYKFFRPLLREHEMDNDKKLLNGATYVLLSAAVCIQWFPKIITVTAFSIMIVSDTAAALYGRRFGKHRFFQKSLEGTGAFFVSALVLLLFMPHAGNFPVEYTIGAIAALVGAVVESASIALRFDDNLSIPLSIGGVMWGSHYLLSVLEPGTYGGLYRSLLGVQ
jgi:dolichol kinase